MTERQTIHDVPTIFRGARGFGLSDEEIWETVNEVREQLPPGKVKPEDLEELIAALAKRIQEKSGSIHSHRAGTDESLP
jgi:hypothetical protein